MRLDAHGNTISASIGPSVIEIGEPGSVGLGKVSCGSLAGVTTA
jgi:hypothetical protein